MSRTAYNETIEEFVVAPVTDRFDRTVTLPGVSGRSLLNQGAERVAACNMDSVGVWVIDCAVAGLNCR
ncbi:hypothetical protein SP19_72 [Salmonella phage 19]|nr:hypothetical protein SP19_72 [Salmonella phage 19]